MNFALGCAFTIKDIYIGFPFKKLKVTCKLCLTLYRDPHKNILVERIFRSCLLLVLKDVINDNVTFELPVYGKVKCDIHMKKVNGDSFKNLRKSGKWQDVDIFTSLFTGYEIGLYLYGARTPRIKTIYINKSLKNIITENTNKGKAYGDSNNIKTVKDYFKKVLELYPKILISDIKRILTYGWKLLYLLNSYGGDLLARDGSFWCYIGNLKKDPLKHFKYYIKKLSVKLKVMYKRKHIKWDGYYYFALTERQYQEALKQHKNGYSKKYIYKLKNIILYKIYEDCRIREYNKKYIFRVPYICEIGSRLLVKDFKRKGVELIESRENILKFKDISTYENKYSFI